MCVFVSLPSSANAWPLGPYGRLGGRRLVASDLVSNLNKLYNTKWILCLKTTTVDRYVP